MRNIDLKYFLYARKSSESEDRQMASIEDQIAEVRSLAEKYNINVVDIISESKSAKEPGRIGFNSMLSRIHKGEAQGILTWKLNRLARNPIDGGQISWMLQQNIIKHIQTFERDYNPSDNVLLMQVEFGMANQYVKDLSLDIRRGMRQKAERGWYPITRLPIGYMHKPGYVLGIDDEIIPNPEQFSILKKLWSLFLTGQHSVADIKRKGAALGLKTKHGKPCSKNTYYYILSNEFYCGYFNWKDRNGNVIKHKGKHKMMVSSSEFEKAQILLSKKVPLSSKKGMHYDHPYRGIINCGECGCAVTPDHKLQAICTICKYKYSIKTRTDCPKCHTELAQMSNPSIIDILYYHCTKSSTPCSQGSIKKEDIDNTIEDGLQKISITKSFFLWAINSLKEKQADTTQDKEIILKLIKRKTALEVRLSGLINLRADNELNAEQFNTSSLKTQHELSLVESEIRKMENQRIEWHHKKESAYNFALDAVKKFRKKDNVGKTEMVRDFASNLTLINKKLYITIEKSLLMAKEPLSNNLSKKSSRT